MSWVRIDDGLPDHPKIVGLSVGARWLYVEGLCYCGRYLTDGFIPAGKARDMAPPRLVTELVEAGLWDRWVGGYRVHDYLDYNPSKKEVNDAREAIHEVKSRAGKIGAARRWQAHSRRMADPMAGAIANAKQKIATSPTPITAPSGLKEIPQSSRSWGTSLDNGARGGDEVVLPLLRAFEQSFGRMLSPMEVELIRTLEDEHPRERIDYALREATALGKRVVRYVQRVCEGQVERGDDRGERKSLGGHPNGAAAPGDAAAAYASLGIRPESLPVRLPARSREAGGVAPVDGDDDPPGLETGG